MGKSSKQLLVTASVLVSATLCFSSASAQSVPGAASPENEANATVANDIIVTARRKSETLLDVPQTINAVSGDKIANLRINSAADIAQIVPGVNIEGGSNGSSGAFGSSSSIRGVPTFLSSNASPVVQFYLNDAATGRGPEASQSLFDIGQIEVLKGPQGTLRGRSTPSGAITITTRRPSLSEFGGYVDMSATDRGAINAQAAVGIPIIEDVLAIRVAGVIDHNQGNGVTSANYRAEPYTKSEAVRGTILFQPTDNLTATLMYQRLERKSRSFPQVVGNGNGRNGPVIAAGDRLGIVDSPNMSKSTSEFLTGQIEWSFAGQKLNYIGMYRKGNSTTSTTQDVANVVPGAEWYQVSTGPAKETSHELRLSSDEWIAGMFDYTVGVYFDRELSHSAVRGAARFLSGAFGAPGAAPVAQSPLERYTLFTGIAVDPVATEKSVFGSVTAHFGKSTELSVGARYINFNRHDRFTLGLAGGFNAIANPTRGALACSALGSVSAQLAGAVASPVYAGACDLPIPGQQLQNVDIQSTSEPLIYNVALSHKFSPDLMVYANVGSAFRSAGPAIGLTSALSCCAGGPNLGSIEDLVFQRPEKSTTYEIGFKSSLFDRKLQLTVALFKQDFKNYFYLTQSTRYLSISDRTNIAGAGAEIGSAEFTSGANAKVKGIDVEATVQIMRKWSANLGFTLSDAKLDDALIPCNDGNFDGTPDNIVPTKQGFINAGTIVARCKSSASIARTPKWNLTLQSEYAAPVSNEAEAFIRGSFAYYPSNPNASEARVIDSYSLLNMFLGLRQEKGQWEVSLFANNLLNTQKVLAFNAVAPISSGSAINFFPQGASGYNQIGYTPRREFGVHLRYAFGGR